MSETRLEEPDLQEAETPSDYALDREIESLNVMREAAEAWNKHVARYARLINSWPAGLTRHSQITEKGAVA